MDCSDIPGTLQSIPRVVVPAARMGTSTVSRDEMRLALRAVLLHTAQQWPGGAYCGSDRSPFPCRMRRWGERVLLSAGWQADRVEAIVRQVGQDVPPWLAGPAPDSVS
ncbi:MAG: hypothetical protein QOI74_1895 [Micromonosporaceae bacterium]|jgi:hypothetical protein|nr:hypothetical protein [Micromonosporaceae bacterium]